MLFLSFLAKVIFYESHRSHYCADVMEFIERGNAGKATETQIVLKLVD
jgi:hypothetical protein